MPQHRYSKLIPVISLSTDLFCLNASIHVANYIKFDSILLSNNYQILQIVLNLIWLPVFFGSRLQIINRNSKILDHLKKVLNGLVINLSIVFTLWFILQPDYYSRNSLFNTYLIFTISILLWRYTWHSFMRFYRTKGFNYRNVLIIGYGQVIEELKQYFKNTPQLGYKVVGILNNTNPTGKRIEDVENYCLGNNVDIIFCNLLNLTDNRIKEIIHFAENNFIKVNLTSQLSQLTSYNLYINRLGNTPVIQINTIPLDNSFNRYIKRSFDIIFSIIICVCILSWLVPIVSLVIKLESKGPIFFKQKRHGKNNKEFNIYKFRTMYLHDDDHVRQATKGDSRITKLGTLLRITSIDELPQFINVLVGHMSVVGPRPHAVQHNIEYHPKINLFWQRHTVKPGITGLAQVKGFRGETSTFNDMNSRVKLDRFYIKNWSLFLDLKIIILTLISTIRGNQKAY